MFPFVVGTRRWRSTLVLTVLDDDLLSMLRRCRDSEEGESRMILNLINSLSTRVFLCYPKLNSVQGWLHLVRKLEQVMSFH